MSLAIRDRIRELRRVPASSLRPSRFNWRTHPTAQLDALKGVLAEVGFATATLAWEPEPGVLETIDGHARAEVSGDALIPVLVLDVDADEAKKLLATFDPIGDLAGCDNAKLDDLLNQIDIESPALQKMLDDLAGKNGVGGEAEDTADGGGETIPEKYQILIEFDDETAQAEWLEKLTAEGLKVRSLIS